VNSTYEDFEDTNSRSAKRLEGIQNQDVQLFKERFEEAPNK
jgi:hypothetical protein